MGGRCLRAGRWLAALALITASGATVAQSTTVPMPQAGLADQIGAGRRIYENGILPSGAPLRAWRAGMMLTGADGACVTCHQPSGMGTLEGKRIVPPVAGRVLYRPVTHDGPRRSRRFEFSARNVRTRPAYDIDKLARAVRDGVSAGGEALAWLMPRYELDAGALAALDAYLRTLSAGTAPGVDADVVHFATVVAPGSAPGREQAMLEVLHACFEQDMADQRKLGGRAWKLHVWHLDGAPAAWDAQLATAWTRQPVFALLSGISGRGWGPIDHFCERSGVPCLFPNTDMPQAGGGSWSMYLSGGLELEAHVLARRIRGAERAATKVVQVFREGGLGADAARLLATALAGSDITVEARALAADALLDARVIETGTNDALVLWLSGEDVARLPDAEAPASAAIYLSGTLGGFESVPLPERWRAAALIVYPVELPAALRARLEYSLRPWLETHGIPPRDERLQGSTLAACNLLIEGMARIRDVYVPQYLVESVEIAMGGAAESAPFPRFALGAGQRFGSKGAYLVKLSADGTVIPDGGWMVP